MLRIYIQIILLIIVIGGRVEAQTRNQSIETDFERATAMHQAGNIDAAIEAYLLILTAHPNRSDVRSNLGAAYTKLGRYNEAVSQYKLALKNDPKNTSIKYNLGLAYYKASLYTNAARELEPIVKLIRDTQPNKYVAVMVTADCLVRLGEYQKVIEMLSPLEAIHGQDKPFAFLLGSALISDGQLHKGQLLIDRVFKSDDSAEAHLLLGSILLEADDGFRAQKELERAIELNPNLPGLQSRYGRTLLRLGDGEKAMNAFKQELQYNPNDFDANMFLGMLFKRDKETNEAHKLLSHAIQLRPKDAYARYHLGSNYSIQGKFNNALPLVENVVKEFPQFTEARSLLALIYYRLRRKADGDREQAIAQKQIAEKQSKQPGVKDGVIIQ